MEFLIKKTTDLTEIEISKICLLFGEVFIGHSKSTGEFKDEFLNTALGFSFHALMVDGDEIVGAHSLIPCHYIIEEKSVLMAFSVDTMIRKKYRDFFNLKNLVDLTEQESRKHGIYFIFGFPNDNSYPIFKKGLNYKDIGSMFTYIYPYRIGGIKTNLRWLNSLSILLCRSWELISVILSNKKEYHALLDKDRTCYNSYRYQWFGKGYRQIVLCDFHFVYRIALHNGIRTAFLIDMDKISGYNIYRAVSYIRRKEGKNFDLLLYVGCLPCKTFPLIKLPRRFEPKKFNFTGKFPDKNNVNEQLFDIKNWNVNLSCYDLI